MSTGRSQTLVSVESDLVSCGAGAGLDRHGFRLGEMVSTSHQHAGDGLSGRRFPQMLTGHLFSAPMSRCPFGHNSQGAAKAACLQSAPQFRAVTATGSPLGIENRQEGVQCVFPRTKNLSSYPPNWCVA
ncbi:hypothetical protein GFPCMMHI_02941 [Ensifer adhaerens]|nr:hypothetical protein [Ensifer adhaerens]